MPITQCIVGSLRGVRVTEGCSVCYVLGNAEGTLRTEELQPLDVTSDRLVATILCACMALPKKYISYINRKIVPVVGSLPLTSYIFQVGLLRRKLPQVFWVDSRPM